MVNRVSICCNLCGDRQDIAMDLTLRDVELISLLGRLLVAESDWNKTITVCDAVQQKPVESTTPP